MQLLLLLLLLHNADVVCAVEQMFAAMSYYHEFHPYRFWLYNTFMLDWYIL